MITAILVLAVLPLALALLNLLAYRTPAPAAVRPRVSILIPARNEEANIAAAVAGALAQRGVDLELVVLDDNSTDRTGAILRTFDDPRLRVIAGAPLPDGWCGKQHACAVLATHAREDLFVFVDADVRLAPDAVSRMAGGLRANSGLASGFPRQTFGSWSERLLLPMIHVLLLGYLPMVFARHFANAGFGAGCGQLFIARADAYARVGGHAAIRTSLHDGVTLPRAFRRRGIMTDLFDASRFASCRMYRDAHEVWEGLSKNATEGLAKPVALPVWSAILAGGHVAPFVAFALAPSAPLAAACACAWGFRLLIALRFHQPRADVLWHPVSVLALLVLQWAALIRAARGRPATWRGRAYPAP